ncbi:MAG: nitrite/sulfite reductase [Bryobacterales bacterium]|nr:nitrite/sulfite reductase [Bryobacterales bacterium]
MTTPNLEPVDTSSEWAQLPPDVRKEIDVYETELRRVQADLVDDKLFTEFRLRHGVYGQRQDRVQMQRIKIPMGRMSADQLVVLADIAEEYAVGVLHVTTRQDFQCHFIDINDTPNLMRRLAAVGITTREACGNVIRNVTCCPHAGVCCDEVFDVTPHAHAMTYFMLRHSDAQNFGRKFKISYSGCESHSCGLGRMHDIGAVARVRDGVQGFQVLVGGGLGALPHQAKVYSEFLPASEMLPLAQAISRVFAKFGEKRIRAKARMKFLIAKQGIDKFRRLVEEERLRLPLDERWESELQGAIATLKDSPLKPPSVLEIDEDSDPGLLEWLDLNVHRQRQSGYSMVDIFLPLGDITSEQARNLAEISRPYVKDTLRTTVDQNLLLQWVSNADLPELYRDLADAGLAEPGAGRLKDVTACPGTDSCKLGITSSRGLAGHLHKKFANGMSGIAHRSDLKIKISGCFNSCGQHHVADIGFFGSVQRKKRDTAPVFQVTLGGSTRANAESYGLGMGKIPAQNVDKAIVKVSEFYSREKRGDETLSDVVARLGKTRVKEELKEFMVLPTFQESPGFYQDTRQPWQYRRSIGIGECAGEVVDQAEFMLEDADRIHFESTIDLERNRYSEASTKAFDACRKAADALLFTKGLWLSDNYDTVEEFRRHFYESSVFYRPFADNFLRSAQEGPSGNPERARLRVEEAMLFIEAAQGVYSQASDF